MGTAMVYPTLLAAIVVPHKASYASISLFVARSSRYHRSGDIPLSTPVGWDRTKDTFQVGQWIKGRIYERQFIYFAMNGKWKTQIKGSWTAISMAPYLKAVGLWASGSC